MHAPTNPTEKLKLMGRGGQCTYIPTLPLTWRLPQALDVNRSEHQLFYLITLTRIRTRDLWLRYHIELNAPTSSTQKLKLMGRGEQFTYIPTISLTWRLPQTSDVE